MFNVYVKIVRIIQIDTAAENKGEGLGHVQPV